MNEKTKALPECLIISDYTFSVSSHELVHNNEITRLEPQVANLLLYLSTRAGKTVSRESLMKELWPGVVVSDEALTNAIKKLRRSFNDNRAAPQYIETIPKTGYRFIADVKPSAPSLNHDKDPVFKCLI